MSPAPGPPSDPVDRRARHREVPGPLEARWVPALLVCLTLGILGVAWDAPARSAAAIWSRMRASSGEMMRLGPPPAARRRRVATK